MSFQFYFNVLSILVYFLWKRKYVHFPVTVMEDNLALKERLMFKAMPRKEYYKIKLENGKSKL